MSIAILAGLGNPGRQYEHTRHNVGFMLLDALMQQDQGQKEHWQEKFEAQIAWLSMAGAEANKLLLVKPLAFMNLSGGPLAEVMRFYKLSPQQLLVAHDDIDLPFGVIKLKSGGGDGGHNGVSSVMEVLGSRDFLRLKLGVGRPSDLDVTRWVLTRFGSEEHKPLEEMLQRASQAVSEVCLGGLKAAQNKFN